MLSKVTGHMLEENKKRTWGKYVWFKTLLMLIFVIWVLIFMSSENFVNASGESKYYIDYENGNDSNNGTSTSTAWKHAPGDIHATLNPLAHTPEPGDTFLFKGGVEYKGQIELKYNWNGSVDAPITYDGNSSGSWGNGKAILDGDEQNFQYAFRTLSDWQQGGLSYLDIKNFIIQNYASYAIGCDDVSYVNISNMYIHDLKNWDLSQCTECVLTDARSGAGISLSGDSNHINISDCEITKVGGTGIGIHDSVHDIDVSNVKIHDYIVWQIDIAPARTGSIISNINIHDSEFYNLYHYGYRYWKRSLLIENSYNWIPSSKGEGEYYVTQKNGNNPEITPVNELWYGYDKATSGSAGTLKPGEWAYADNDNLGFKTVYIRLSDGGDPDDLSTVEMISIVEALYDDEKVRPGIGENPHQDGIFMRNPQNGTLDNIRIYNNDFYDEREYINASGTAMLYISQPKDNDSIYIYNNVFHPVHLPSLKMWLGSGNIYIYNNTFIGRGICGGRPASEGSSQTKIYFKNNVVNSAGSKFQFNFREELDRDHLDSDYNIFSFGDMFAGQVTPYTAYDTLEDWQQEFGQDLNSIAVDDIRFINPQGPCPPENSDYHLIPDSMAIDNGVDLGAEYQYDKDGNLRGEDGAWDIGAYEFQGIDHPVANIKYTNIINGLSGYEPFKVNFNGSSSYALENRQIVSYEWNFGDGNTYAGAVVSHTFSAGEYTVSLTVTDNTGSFDTVNVIFAILPSEYPNLYLHLPLDGYFQDTSGKNMKTSWIGTPLYEDVINGKASRFNQDSSRGIEIEHSDYLDGMEELSIAFWAKKENLTSSRVVVFKYGIYEITLVKGGLKVKLVSADGYEYAECNDIFSDTNWHHYVVTYDGSSIVIYIDGNKIIKKEFSGRIGHNSSRIVYIGRNPWSESLDGLMDDIRIYDKALSIGEIAQIMSSTNPSIHKPVISEHPSSQTAALGSDVTLSVIVSAYPEPTYQWQRKGQSDFEDLPNETKTTLTIKDIKADDAGEYRVVVKNSEGIAVSNPATLTVVEISPISEFIGIAEFYSTYLSWDNPIGQSDSWDKVIILRKKDSKPENYEDGVVVFDGNANSYIDRNLSKGTYQYAIFTYKEATTNKVYSEPSYLDEAIELPQKYNKELLRIDSNSEERHIVIGQNTRGDLYSLWNTSSNVIGKGPGGNETGLWVYSDIVGASDKQLPDDSKIVSARLVFNVEDFEQISVENFAKVEDESGKSSDISNKTHTLNIYQIKDPDNLGMPEFAEESGLRSGLDYKFRDHRPGVNIPWVTNVSDNNANTDTNSYSNTDIMDLLKGVEPIDEVRFYPEVYQNGLVKTMQFDITGAVQAWVDDEDEQGLFITIAEDWVNGESLKLSGISAEEEASRPYIEIIYGPDDGSVDLNAPAPVENIDMIPGQDNITLSWNEPSDNDLKGYKILRKEGIEPFNEFDNYFVADVIHENYLLSDGKYVDKGLETGKTYYYTIYAYDSSHNYSEKVCIKATTGAPASPVELTDVSVNDGVVKLSWNMVTGAGSYLIYRRDSLGNIMKIPFRQEISPTFTNNDYPLEGEYTYWITAVNENGEGPLSENKIVTVDNTNRAANGPAGNIMLSGEVLSSSEYKLSWNYQYNDVSRFIIERKTSSGEWQEIGSTEYNVREFVDDGLNPVIDYIYRIKAINSSGKSKNSNEISRGECNEPVAVKNLNWEVISSSQIKVSWEDTPNEESYQVKLYSGGDEVETIDISGNKTYCYFVTLKPGKEYRVRIVSVNSSGSIWALSDVIRTSTDAKGGLF